MKKVLLLLADGFEIFEASAFIDVIGWNLVDGDKSTKLVTCGLRRELKSTFGQEFRAEMVASKVNPADFAALAIPGGFEEYGFYRDAYADEFSELIRKFDALGKPIATICTGALPVARAGVLRGRRGTTYNMNPVRQAALREFGVVVENTPVVTDGNVTTSWNPSTAMDVAFGLLETLTSRENTANIRRIMGF